MADSTAKISLNQKLQTSNDELMKRISEVLEAVHNTAPEKPPSSPARSYSPLSIPYSTQVMNTTPQNINKPYIPVSGINSLVMSMSPPIMPTHPLPTSSFRNYSLPPVFTIAYPWPPTVEGNPVRPQSPSLNLSMPKMDFPKFEGKDPRGWIKKCEKFFQLNPILDSKTKVLYAALYLEGEADVWYQSFQNEHTCL